MKFLILFLIVTTAFQILCVCLFRSKKYLIVYTRRNYLTQFNFVIQLNNIHITLDVSWCFNTLPAKWILSCLIRSWSALRKEPHYSYIFTLHRKNSLSIEKDKTSHFENFSHVSYLNWIAVQNCLQLSW